MRQVVIGTAGHVDHGKSTLVKALTGTNPDRWKEEQERGITIDLGFAYFSLPSGRTASIVDVPGHERFIRNMVAGVIGMDLVMLVVAADEGVMPQTREHIDILDLLQVKRGIVVLNKTDLVDPDWLELVEDDLRATLKGTFLEYAPVVRASAVTGAGLPELVALADQMTQEIEPRDTEAPFRLPVDRAFSMPGFGTVITGTLIAGTLTAGSRAELVPGGPQVRVRQVQVHNEKVDRAEAGQRTAANLVGVEEAQIRRGHVLAEPGAIAVTERLDARLRLLKSAPHPLKNRDRVHFYTGTAEVLARVRLLDCEVLEPGREALVQWVLEEPVALARQDAYVVRSYSPLFTIGGGKVIRAIAPSYRSSQKDVVDMLRRIEHGEPRDLVLVALEEGELIRTAPVLARQVGISQSPVKEILDSAAGNGEVHKLEGEGGPYYAGGERLSGVKERLTEIVSSYHRGYQWQPGILKEELRQRLAEELTSRTMNLLLDLWQRERVVNVDGNYVSIPGFTVAFTGDAKVLVDAILKAVKEGNLQPPLFSEIRPTLPKVKSSGLDAGEIWDALCARGDLRRITDDLAYTPEVYNRAKSSLIAVLRQKGEITVAGFRDLLQVSRKYSLPLLEHFDHERVTLRAGDARRLNPAYVDSSDPESPITQSTEVES